METNKYIIDFQKVLIDTNNKKILLELEIREIEKLIHKEENLYLGIGNNLIKYQSKSVFQFDYYPSQFFNNVVHNYLLNNEFNFNSISDNRFKERDIKVAKNAIDFADYYKWLKNINSDTPKSKSLNKSDLTLSQKILSLHYLGLKLDDYDKTKSSKILSKILNQSEDNTRKYLNQLSSATKESELKSTKNLNTLLELFENEQFKEVQNKIKKDIDKLG
ncbi:hypothetical protein [Polaribacter glomeratus]|uniref:Uncharacterized protein n=1 Tax=Polaribacter glomeratus TaxID=102 RepID=A0A2S7WZ48_9FLAO|nr:hypothetical protein [Polaribacter glomeratus]PQJ82778.1 hypothetical protein BTO16_09395 [Polaribacter glomeratus]TXD65321.1 hypothetical protein ESX12_10880 [Polaribacter glomeratus]